MRRKIVHVVTRLDMGGAQLNTLHTVRNLDAARFETLLVCGEGGALDEEVRRDSGLRTVFLDSLVREVSPLRDLLALLEIRRLFAAERPDVVHTHSSKAGIIGRLAAALAGVEVIVHTYHGFGFHDRQNPVVKSLYVALERLCAAVTTRLVFVSRANQDYAVRHRIRGARRGVVIRSGVRLRDFPADVDSAALRGSAGIGAEDPLVVSIGNLKAQKNAADFIAAAAAVAAHVPDAHFVFLGDGPLRPAMEARARALGLQDRIHLLGWRRDGAQWLAASDVFAMTSLWEGLPRSLVEAMKTGLPTVSYSIDGIKDVLHDGVNGYLIDPGDVSAFADRLVRLLRDDGLRRRLGQAAARGIGPEFDIDGMVLSQQTLYDGLLAARHD